MSEPQNLNMNPNSCHLLLEVPLPGSMVTLLGVVLASSTAHNQNRYSFTPHNGWCSPHKFNPHL